MPKKQSRPTTRLGYRIMSRWLTVFGLGVGAVLGLVLFFSYFLPILAFVLACGAVAGVLYAVIKGVQ
jgi:hypothetical protein